MPQAKEVTLQTHGYDKYGRTLADVLLPDGTNVNHTLVKDGWCWWYRKYAPGDTVLEGLENEAREARKGLWADPQPVPPWEWRQLRRSRETHLTTHLLQDLPSHLPKLTASHGRLSCASPRLRCSRWPISKSGWPTSEVLPLGLSPAMACANLCP